MLSATPPLSSFLTGLRRALLSDFESEMLLACRVAVYQAAGYRRSEIARLLDAPPAALRGAEARVKKAAERMDHGEN